ncbi:hypothetical protein [Pseudomonas hamedanensis]|uniref:Uncharacterized protein n=1 Tax=Pseudomonas hamedanensis TaxID=2745504 RepID=A0A9E6NWC2_9PSED|nr:hypothetical protein [Pseudomonas hamedanensis]QXI15318.1 hypothetical protein HU739_015460 [Pseudomonas hamedanensis]
MRPLILFMTLFRSFMGLLFLSAQISDGRVQVVVDGRALASQMHDSVELELKKGVPL